LVASLSNLAESLPWDYADSFTSADGTTRKQLFPNRDTLGRVDYVLFSNSDSVAHTFALTLETQNSDGHLGEVVIPAGAGHGAVKPFEAFAAIFPTGLNGIAIDAARNLYANAVTALPGGVTVTFTVLGGLL
jgi:hypothetical protein